MGITQLANKPKIECDSREDAVTDTQKLVINMILDSEQNIPRILSI